MRVLKMPELPCVQEHSCYMKEVGKRAMVNVCVVNDRDW